MFHGRGEGICCAALSVIDQSTHIFYQRDDQSQQGPHQDTVETVVGLGGRTAWLISADTYPPHADVPTLFDIVGSNEFRMGGYMAGPRLMYTLQEKSVFADGLV